MLFAVKSSALTSLHCTPFAVKLSEFMSLHTTVSAFRSLHETSQPVSPSSLLIVRSPLMVIVEFCADTLTSPDSTIDCCKMFEIENMLQKRSLIDLFSPFGRVFALSTSSPSM